MIGNGTPSSQSKAPFPKPMTSLLRATFGRRAPTTTHIAPIGSPGVGSESHGHFEGGGELKALHGVALWTRLKAGEPPMAEFYFGISLFGICTLIAMGITFAFH